MSARRAETKRRRSRRTLRVVLVAGLGSCVLVVSAAVWFETTSYRPSVQEHAGDLALVGGTVLTGDSLTSVTDGVVLIRDGVITDVGRAGEVTPPAGATVVDVSGYTVSPGLVDMHVHLGSPDLEVGEEPGVSATVQAVLETVRFAPGYRRSALEHGVTTVRSLGDELGWVSDMRSQVAGGELEGPRIVMSGPLFTTRGGHPVATVGTDADSDTVRLPSGPQEARSMVRALALDGDAVDVIKVVQDRGSGDRPLDPLPLDTLRAIVEEAHLHGLPVTAHWGTLRDLDDVLSVGVDGLEHIESRDLLGGWPDDVLARLLAADVPITAGVVVSEAALAEGDVPSAVSALQARVGEFHAAGGRVVVGSDAARPGVRFGAGVHRELKLLVEAGMSPREALHAATVEPARVLGVTDYGLIASGMSADLVVVEGDPTSDIDAISKVMVVVRDGRLVVDRRDPA